MLRGLRFAEADSIAETLLSEDGLRIEGMLMKSRAAQGREGSRRLRERSTRPSRNARTTCRCCANAASSFSITEHPMRPN